MANNRIHYIDVLKGLGIIFVVFAHMNTMPLCGGYFYLFHMPLFFFISGLLLDPMKYPYKRFVISRIKQLYIPYVVLYLLLYIYWVVVERPMRYFKMPQLDAFWGLFWGTNSSYWIYPGGVMWFVIALFSLELIVFSVLKWCKLLYLRLVLFGLLVVVGLLCSKYHLFVLPFSLPNALLVLPFFMVGYLMRRYLLLSNIFYMESKLVVLYILIPLVVFTCWQYPWLCNLGKQTDVSFLMRPHFYWFYSIPFVEIGLWFLISMLIDKNRFLEYLGRNTLPILAFHLPVSRALMYMSYRIWGCDRYVIREDVFKSICLTIVVMLCCWPFIILWNKVFPLVVAFIFRNKKTI